MYTYEQGIVSTLFYFNVLEKYIGICKLWQLKLGEIIGNVFDIMLNEKIRQNCIALVNYVYLLASSRGNTLNHLINNV